MTLLSPPPCSPSTTLPFYQTIRLDERPIRVPNGDENQIVCKILLSYFRSLSLQSSNFLNFMIFKDRLCDSLPAKEIKRENDAHDELPKVRYLLPWSLLVDY
jgi:hypothetical protein